MSSTARMAAVTVIPLRQTLESLPLPAGKTGLADYISNNEGDLPLLVVLDDDPTGTQTCHDINVLTAWDQNILVSEFNSTRRGFFILTNSRALHTTEARTLVKSICSAVKAAAAEAGKDFEIVLRGDSTLRGHFPDEPEVAEGVIGNVDGWILAPYFRQGGRLTINDTHYVVEEDQNLVPVAQTPFAQDATFGFKSSNLRDYVVEKSQGSISADQVQSISLTDIRLGGPSVVAERLLDFDKKSVIVVNAVVDTDMEVFVQGLLEGEFF